jgi:hypothetical protein
MPMAREMPASPYFDTPVPRNFQNVTPLDPQLFLSCSQYAEELLRGRRSCKYSPTEVAHWLETIADEADNALASAGKPASIDATRLAIDITVQALLGRFYAAKLRAGVLMALYERSGDATALKGCQAQYREAVVQWQKIVAKTHGIYASDLGISDRLTEHGQWADKRALITSDLAAVEALLPKSDGDAKAGVVAERIMHREDTKRGPLAIGHETPAAFTRGEACPLSISVNETLVEATLWVRRVTAAERWSAITMTVAPSGWQGTIPASLTDGAYPLQYYFELRADDEKVWLAPGFNATQSNQPYVVVRPG